MSQASPTTEPQSPTAESQSPTQAISSKSARLTDPQRFWVLHYLCRAQALLNVDEENVSAKTYRKTCELLDSNKHRHNLTHNPSQQSIKKLWSTVSKTGIVAGKRVGGGRKTPYREEVEFLAKSTDLSVRELTKQLAPELSISRETVRRIVKSLGKNTYKRSKQKLQSQKEKTP